MSESEPKNEITYAFAAVGPKLNATLNIFPFQKNSALSVEHGLTASAASAPLAEQRVCALGNPSAEKLKLMLFGFGFPAEGEKVVKPLMVKVWGMAGLVMS